VCNIFRKYGRPFRASELFLTLNLTYPSTLGAGFSSLTWDATQFRQGPNWGVFTVFTKSVLPHTVSPIQWLPLASVFADKNGQVLWLTNHLHPLLRLGMSGALPPFYLFAFIAHIGTSLPGWLLSPEVSWFCLVREFPKFYEAVRKGTAITKASQWFMWATEPAESSPHASIPFLSSRLHIHRRCS
jgi:hypothetical protein